MHTPSRRSLLSNLMWPVSLLALAGIGYVTYLFNKPKRQVAMEKTYEVISVQDLTRQFEEDPVRANAKYLSSDGNSTILDVYGEVTRISKNLSGGTVIVLSGPSAPAHVRCTMATGFDTLLRIPIGDPVHIKGAITAGNGFDSVLELRNDAVLIDGSLVKPAMAQ